MSFTSQIGQDEFVLNAARKHLAGKYTFLDIGCHDYKEISNTYALEKDYGWRGVGIDIDPKWEAGWKENRDSVFVLADATTADYGKILSEASMPIVIDYLSMDLEPPPLTLKALERLFEFGYGFNIITYETDFYRNGEFGDLRSPSREFLNDRGYVLVKEGEQDDFYIHQSIL